MSKIETKCAFCKGTGKDPFDLLSELATCQVCGGRGKVEVAEPAIKCAFCKATGVYPRNARVTCTVCNGKGMVTVKGATEECFKCKGTGTAIESGLPCIKCGGKGVISKK
jgi:DnaJ-class molecular chaperone